MIRKVDVAVVVYLVVSGVECGVRGMVGRDGEIINM